MSNINIMEEIRQFIKHEMKRQKVTGDELAKRCGLASATVSCFINGTRSCYLSTVCMILEELGYTIKLEENASSKNK